MGKPRMIIVIRHGQSEGNKNRDIHQTVPDHRVKLTSDGRSQAYEAGRRLRSMLREDDTLHFFTSPYRRTRETTEGILSTLTSDDPTPSPFQRNKIKVHEEPRLREQDFGNFQPCSVEMERMWQERADYGHFFFRIPNGESAADAYDRVSGFNESLWRQFGEDDFASVCVLVTHGLMSRVFLMKWYHFSVEHFEDLRNTDHCEFLIMRKELDSGKYILDAKLRTWSQLKKDRAAQKERDKEISSLISDNNEVKETRLLVGSGSGTGKSPDIPNLPFRKRWGGCPNGCEHGKNHFKKGNPMHPMQMNGTYSPSTTSSSTQFSPEMENSPLAVRRPATARRWQNSSPISDDDDDDNHQTSQDARGRSIGPPSLDMQKSPEDLISSPDGTPSFISMDDRLRNQLLSPKSKLSTCSTTFEHINGFASGGFNIHPAVREFSFSDCDTDLSQEEDARKKILKASSGRSPLSKTTFKEERGENPLKNRPVQIFKGNTESKAQHGSINGGVKKASYIPHDVMADPLGDIGQSDHDGGDEGEDEADKVFENGLDTPKQFYAKQNHEQMADEQEKSVMGSVL